MHITYDPVGEDFLLIDQGRVIQRIFIDPGSCPEDTEDAHRFLMRLKRPVTRADQSRSPIDKKIMIDESKITRYDKRGRPILDDLFIELDITA
jgi:hypothetical protein